MCLLFVVTASPFIDLPVLQDACSVKCLLDSNITVNSLVLILLWLKSVIKNYIAVWSRAAISLLAVKNKQTKKPECWWTLSVLQSCVCVGLFHLIRCPSLLKSCCWFVLECAKLKGTWIWPVKSKSHVDRYHWANLDRISGLFLWEFYASHIMLTTPCSD